MTKSSKNINSKNSEVKKKAPKKRLINVDKQHFEIKKKLRLQSRKLLKITKRVDNFIYLSNLMTQKQQVNEPKKQDKQEKTPRKILKRPMTSRDNRIKI